MTNNNSQNLICERFIINLEPYTLFSNSCILVRTKIGRAKQ